MNKIYDTLNDMQQMATFHTDGPLLISGWRRFRQDKRTDSGELHI